MEQNKATKAESEEIKMSYYVWATTESNPDELYGPDTLDACVAWRDSYAPDAEICDEDGAGVYLQGISSQGTSCYSPA